jgi:uncharacterized protein (DUF362 family)
MKRRDFLAKSIGAGIAVGAAASVGGMNRLFAASPAAEYDLTAIMGGAAEVMFDKGIKAMGGMGRFVKKGQTVVVKPNIGWDVVPEKAANTNPKLVGRIVERCFEAGAKTVYVFDHTCDDWVKCYKNSAIEAAVKKAGGKMVPGHTESYYQEVSIPEGKVLKTTKEHELVLESDVYINVPVLKSHSSTKLSIAMKNLMGAVWDRGYWHRNDLHQCIADFVTYRKPDLNIVDGYRVMKKNGPRGVSVQDVDTMKVQVISPDIVAADAASAKFFGVDPENVMYMRLADQMGVGTIDLNKLEINRIKV